MNDNEGEIGEEMRVLVEGVTEVMQVLQKYDDAHVAMQILASDRKSTRLNSSH